MTFCPSPKSEADLDAHDGIFAVSREEWEQSPDFHEKVLERQDRQLEREQAFLSHEGNCFAIYQVSKDDPQNVRFMNLDWLQSHNLSVERSNYDLIYTAPLDGSGSTMEQLERLYEQFNLQKPVDFHSPSMSVSDIVAIKQVSSITAQRSRQWPSWNNRPAVVSPFLLWTWQQPSIERNGKRKSP